MPAPATPAPATPARAAPALPNEAEIAALVDRFYDKVRVDAVLGPVFDAAIEDWAPHLATMKNFWSSVMLTTGLYKGNPFAAHIRHPIEPGHFVRWLGLFRETAAEVVGTDRARLFVEKAERIAASLQMGLFGLPPLETPAAPPARHQIA
jgi:hemoglobin